MVITIIIIVIITYTQLSWVTVYCRMEWKTFNICLFLDGYLAGIECVDYSFQEGLPLAFSRVPTVLGR